MAGKLLTGKNMVDLGQNPHFFPAIIIPSKVDFAVKLWFYELYMYGEHILLSRDFKIRQ